jgi:hypothetical protein
MNGHFITPLELGLLLVVLGAPVVLLATACQVFYLRSRGLGGRGHRLRFTLVVGFTVAATYVLTLVVWVVVPQNLLDWPGTVGTWPFMVAGLFFVPSMLAAAAVVPPVTWLARRWAPA